MCSGAQHAVLRTHSTIKVRVPGSSEDAGFHRNFQGKEDAQVKIEEKTEALL